MRYPLRTDYEDEEFHLAHAGPFVLMNWRGVYRAENFARIEEVHHRLAARRRVNVTGVSVVEADSPIPGEEIRVAGTDMMTRTQSTTNAVVIIFLDQGFAASALQSVAARELSLGGRVPMKFFQDIPTAAQWLAQLYPRLEVVPQDMELLLEKLRVRFSPSRLPGPPSSGATGNGTPPWSSVPPSSDSDRPSPSPRSPDRAAPDHAAARPAPRRTPSPRKR